MKNILILLFSCLILFGCQSNDHYNVDQFTRNAVVNSTDSSNIQYNIEWDNINFSPVDIRIITLTKDGESHDYVVANNYIGRAGGLDIEHWQGCKCFKK